MAKLVDVSSIGYDFESLDDPRHTRNRKHRLVDIAVIAVRAIVCGCDGPTAIPGWAVHRAPWLARLLPLPNGIPSRDCIRRLLAALKPEAFQSCFHDRIRDAIAADSDHLDAIPSDPDRPDAAPSDPGHPDHPGRLVAIDGKCCRGSHDRANGLGALHIVGAWATEQGIAPGQVATDAKSNEITVIPLLLEQIELAGALITIDAMGCQKDIVGPIVTGGGHCVIAVKDDHGEAQVRDRGVLRRLPGARPEGPRVRVSRDAEGGHGRVDERSYDLEEVPRDFAPAAEWPWIKAIGCAVRITRHADGTVSDEVRYDLSGRHLSGERSGEAVRGHWGIESMPWVLDVDFREDEGRIRDRTSGDDLSWPRRYAATLLRRHSAKDSIRGKVRSCMIDTDFLMQVLSI